MGGKGSGRLNATDRILKNATQFVSTPASNNNAIGGDFILPNYSGIDKAALNQGSYGKVGSVLFLDANGKINTDANNFWWDDTNNRLGIGTSSPSKTLDVVGLVGISSSSNSGNLFMGSDNRAKLVASSDVLSLQTFRSSVYQPDIVILKSNGNVGIGTDSPDSNLHIKEAGSAIVRIEGTTAGRLMFESSSHEMLLQLLDADGRFRFYDQDTGTERLTILNGGEVGIGTIDPKVPLEVVDEIRIDDGGGVSQTARLSFTDTPARGQLEYTTSLFQMTSTKPILINNTGTTDVTLQADGGNVILRPDTATHGVGIGTDDPEAYLHFKEADFLDTALFERSGVTTDVMWAGARLLATKTSNMGDDFGSGLFFQIRDDADVLNNLGGIGASRDGADNNGKLEFQTVTGAATPSTKMTIENGGNVGIGTKDPRYNNNGTFRDVRTLITSTGSLGELSLASEMKSDDRGPSIGLLRQRAGEARVEDDDNLGGLTWYSWDDAKYRHSGNIRLKVDGATTTLQIPPTYLSFATSAGNANPVENMVIDKDGKVGIGDSAPTKKLNVNAGTDNVISEFTSTDSLGAIHVEDNDTSAYLAAENDYASVGGSAGLAGTNLNIHDTTGFVGMQTTTPTQPLSVAEKICMTKTGGIAIKLTNQTGATTVQGQIVKPDTANDDSFILCATSDAEIIGVVLESGVADRAEAWIVVSGIADVAMEDNVGATRQDVIISSPTDAGYSLPSAGVPSVANHWREVGHVIESVAAGGIGTRILARCVIHFN